MRSASGRFNLNLGRRDKTPAQPVSDDADVSSSPVGSASGASHAIMGGGFGGGHPDRATNGSGGGGDLGKMIKSKVAHTTIMPNIMGTQSLRELQDLITAEKGILQSHERLANDISKGCNAMSTWGASEGSDLSDIMSHASAILMHLSNAMNKYAEHEASVRVLYKSIRTREEELEEMVKRRKHLGSRAEKEEKKLAKMGQENKNLPSQTELLESLRDQMRQLDTEILMEEAKVGDYKRLTAKKALGLKFGGCLELAEKATIVGELGKLLVEEIPLEETPPGYGRAPYHGFEQTQRLANEAARCVSDVVFHPTEVKPLPPGLPHNQSFEPLRTPSVSHLNGEPADEYRRYASAFGEDPNGIASRQGSQGYNPSQMAPLGLGNPQYPYNAATTQFEAEGTPNVMFAAPTSPAASRNVSYALDAGQGAMPTLGQQLAGHDYEYTQAKQAEMDRYQSQKSQVTPPGSVSARPWDGGIEGEHERPTDNQSGLTAATTAVDPQEGGESTLAYLSSNDEQSTIPPPGGLSPAPVIRNGGGKIMDRGRVTRRHADAEEDGVTTSYYARHNPVSSPIIPTEDDEANTAARSEVLREREAFGLAVGDDGRDKFYTPMGSPGVSNRPTFPGSGQRTISASAFKRNKDTVRSPVTPTSGSVATFDYNLAPTAPLNVVRPTSAQGDVATGSGGANIPAETNGDRSAPMRHDLGSFEDDVDVGLGAPLPPPIYGDSHHDSAVTQERADLG